MSDKIQRIADVRQWLQQEDDRRAREAALPRALCRICGGWAKAGEGDRYEPPARGLLIDPVNPERRRIAGPVNAPANADDWRRECQSCASASMAELVGAVLGAEVAEGDASTVVQRLKSIDPELQIHVDFPTAQALGVATGKPWGHVRREHRERVRQVLREVISERLPGISKWGACGLCGRRHSVRWFEGPGYMTWRDGSKAPVCAECQEIVDRRPAADNIQRLRAIAVEAATGHAQMYYAAPEFFRCYFESHDSDGNGYAEPWSYSPGIIAFCEEMWTDRPHLAPEERRPEFEQRRREQIEQNRREEQEREQSQVAVAW